MPSLRYTGSADDMLVQYTNPQTIQTTALERLSEQVLGGDVVADGNNVYTFTLEFNAQCAADFATTVVKKCDSLYPSRTQSFEDLYKWMSDWDYQGIYAYPSTTTIELVFDRKFIIDRAVKVPGTNYKQIILPQFSTFKIGNYKFGMYYPISLQVRPVYKYNYKNNEISEEILDYDNTIITTQWVTDVENPLFSLDTNIIEHRNAKQDGVSIICLQVPIHQFVVTSETRDISANTGFYESYDFTDQFYVCRIYHLFNNEWVEIGQTYSDVVYDPNILTAIVKVDTEDKKFTIDIPQVYFTKQLVGSKLKVEVYTTLGEINEDITDYTDNQFSASFLTNDEVAKDEYSNMLKYVNYCKVLPVAARISSGRNALSFDELKRRVIHNTNKKVLVTGRMVTDYLKDNGLDGRLYLDNVTNRYFLAEKILTDDNNKIISAGMMLSKFSGSDFYSIFNTDENKWKIKNHDTFVYCDDNTTVILPDTWYKYDENKNISTPLTNEWRTKFNELSNIEKVNLLNSGVYTFSPFTIRVSTKNNIPSVQLYDLTNPKVELVSFVSENDTTNTQVSVYTTDITYIEKDTEYFDPTDLMVKKHKGGYQLDVTLYQTDDIVDLPIMNKDIPTQYNICGLLRIKTVDGNIAYLFGKQAFNPDGSILKRNNRNVMRFDLSSTFVIDVDNDLQLSTFVKMNETKASNIFVKMTDDYDILFFINKNAIENRNASMYTSNFSIPLENLPIILQNDYIWLSWHSLTIKLNETIDTILTDSALSVDSVVYKTYPTTSFATYSTDMYYRFTAADVGSESWTGELVTKDMIGIYKYPLEKTHNAGEVIVTPIDRITIKDNDVVKYVDVYNPISVTETSVTDNIETHNTYVLCGVYGAYSSPYFTYVKLDTTYPTRSRIVTEDDIDAGKFYNDLGVEKQLTEADIGKNLFIEDRNVRYEIQDGLKFIISEIKKSENQFDNISDLYSTIVQTEHKEDDVTTYDYAIVDKRKTNFAYVRNADEDSSTPENTLENVEPINVNSAVYRANLDIDVQEAFRLTYNESTTPTIFDGETLFEFWKDLIKLQAFEVIKKWDIKRTTYDKFMQILFPFIKVVETDSIQMLEDYIDTTTTTVIVKDKDVVVSEEEIETSIILKYQNLFNRKSIINVSGVIINPDDYEVGDVFFWDNIPIGYAFPKTVIADLVIDEEIDNCCMLGVIESDDSGYNMITSVITGKNYKECIDFLYSLNTFNGFIGIKHNDIVNDNNNLITPVIEYYQLLSIQDGKYNLNHNTTNWRLIDHWLWELDVYPKHDYVNGLYIENISYAYNDDSSAVISHRAGEIMLNENQAAQAYVIDGEGNPVIDDVGTLRNTAISTHLIQLDVKLLYSQAPEHSDYKNNVVDDIKSYFPVIRTTRNRLIEGTDLFFAPKTSVGWGTFLTSQNDIIRANLDVSLGFKLYVEPYVTTNVNLKTYIRNTIIEIIDESLNNGTVNCVDIAAKIKANLSDSIIHVDVLGINNDITQQTLRGLDENSIPHLGYRLTIDDDNTINIERSLDLDYIVIPN